MTGKTNCGGGGSAPGGDSGALVAQVTAVGNNKSSDRVAAQATATWTADQDYDDLMIFCGVTHATWLGGSDHVWGGAYDRNGYDISSSKIYYSIDSVLCNGSINKLTKKDSYWIASGIKAGDVITCSGRSGSWDRFYEINVNMLIWNLE